MRKIMDYREVPIGFGLALAQNEDAVNAFAMMTGEQKQEIWARARNVRSKKEMQDLVASLAQPSIS